MFQGQEIMGADQIPTGHTMKWDTRFIEMATLVSSWSKDPSTKVGCVLVDKKRRVVSVGFNGPPSKTIDAEYQREVRLRRSIHAEANALHFATSDVSGCTAYITHPPCSHCTAHLIQRGVSRIVARRGTSDFETRWGDDIRESHAMCSESGVVIVYLKEQE
jgi:dCMP deaminase